MTTYVLKLNEEDRRTSIPSISWWLDGMRARRIAPDPTNARRLKVVMVLLVAARLRQVDLPLPPMPNEMWFLILEFVPRWALGSLN